MVLHTPSSSFVTLPGNEKITLPFFYKHIFMLLEGHLAQEYTGTVPVTVSCNWDFHCNCDFNCHCPVTETVILAVTAPVTVILTVIVTVPVPLTVNFNFNCN